MSANDDGTRRSNLDTSNHRGPILIVDDDPHILRALSRILRHEGHDVLEAQSGEDALSLTREHDPSLVVLDYMMPGMDGEMVLAQMRQEHLEHAPPAVLLTASEPQQQRAESIGAVLGLCKPFQVEELLAAIDRHRRTRPTRQS